MTNIGAILYPKLRDVCATYPLVAENTTKFPFIIYRTTATRPETTKDGIYDWIFNVEVDVVDDKYDNVVSLCDDAITKLMELEESFDINISEVSEDYVDDAYVRKINIIIKL